MLLHQGNLTDQKQGSQSSNSFEGQVVQNSLNC